MAWQRAKAAYRWQRQAHVWHIALKRAAARHNVNAAPHMRSSINNIAQRAARNENAYRGESGAAAWRSAAAAMTRKYHRIIGSA